MRRSFNIKTDNNPYAKPNTTKYLRKKCIYIYEVSSASVSLNTPEFTVQSSNYIPIIKIIKKFCTEFIFKFLLIRKLSHHAINKRAGFKFGEITII